MSPPCPTGPAPCRLSCRPQPQFYLCRASVWARGGEQGAVQPHYLRCQAEHAGGIGPEDIAADPGTGLERKSGLRREIVGVGGGPSGGLGIVGVVPVLGVISATGRAEGLVLAWNHHLCLCTTKNNTMGVFAAFSGAP